MDCPARTYNSRHCSRKVCEMDLYLYHLHHLHPTFYSQLTNYNMKLCVLGHNYVSACM